MPLSFFGGLSIPKGKLDSIRQTNTTPQRQNNDTPIYTNDIKLSQQMTTWLNSCREALFGLSPPDPKMTNTWSFWVRFSSVLTPKTWSTLGAKSRSGLWCTQELVMIHGAARAVISMWISDLLLRQFWTELLEEGRRLENPISNVKCYWAVVLVVILVSYCCLLFVTLSY